MSKKQNTLRIRREDGLKLGRMFYEDPTLQIIELPLSKAAEEIDTKTVTKEHRQRQTLTDNYFVWRFFNRTMPTFLIYGLTVAWLVTAIGWLAGLTAVFVWSFVDLFFGSVAYKSEVMK